MAKASKYYLKEIYERFSYLATWLPNTNLRLGDVGIQDGQNFKQMTTLKDLNVFFKTRKGLSKIDFNYVSQSGVALKPKLTGEIALGNSLPVGQASISIQFNREGAFLFQAAGCIVDEIEDKVALGKAVVRLFEAGIWDPSWAVVDTVVKAKHATIIVSISGNAILDLSAKAPITEANLANLGAELSISSQKGDVVKFISAKGLTPLFRLSRAKQSFLSKFLGVSKPITFGGGASEEIAEESFDENIFEPIVPE